MVRAARARLHRAQSRQPREGTSGPKEDIRRADRTVWVGYAVSTGEAAEAWGPLTVEMPGLTPEAAERLGLTLVLNSFYEERPNGEWEARLEPVANASVKGLPTIRAEGWTANEAREALIREWTAVYYAQSDEAEERIDLAACYGRLVPEEKVEPLPWPPENGFQRNHDRIKT